MFLLFVVKGGAIMTGINMSNVKIKNRASILRVLKSEGSLSRKDIANKIGLTPAAVSILVGELISEKIVKERGEVEDSTKKVGRKKILVDINYNKYYVIGVDIGLEFTKIGIANLKGNILNSMLITTNKDLKPKEFLKELAQKCMSFLWSNNVLKENILGFGVGIIGVVDFKKGISKHAYGLWNQEVPIKKILEDILQANVIVDNNVRALALAEIDHNNQTRGNNILFVKHGPGIGSAMIINKEIYYGSTNMAGEIGHMILDSNGSLCRCGKRGCLETIVSKKAVINKLQEKTPQDTTLDLNMYKDLNFKTLLDETELEKGDIIKLINEMAFYMGLGISNVITIYDPNKVILHGELFKYKIFMLELKNNLKNMLPNNNLKGFILLSELKEGYISGTSIAIQNFFFKTGGIIPKLTIKGN
ncbi:ROK family protein [Iocasia frigidifontis]|uniref:ROK family protein n=2 Tax=Iocasia fonsfrigidae TaxID=2682810 RepID=A0A8A7KLR0_9FIRM|nr:ROK family protein [Iocasia fonsfrigidae]